MPFHFCLLSVFLQSTHCKTLSKCAVPYTFPSPHLTSPGTLSSAVVMAAWNSLYWACFIWYVGVVIFLGILCNGFACRPHTDNLSCK